MAKGFGEKRNQEIGFTLVVIPEAKAYAARSDLDYFGKGEPFFGVTSVLEDAQIWKTKKEAKNAAYNYLSWLLEDYDEGDVVELELEISSFFKDKKGKLHDRVVDHILLQTLPQDMVEDLPDENRIPAKKSMLGKAQDFIGNLLNPKSTIEEK